MPWKKRGTKYFCVITYLEDKNHSKTVACKNFSQEVLTLTIIPRKKPKFIVGHTKFSRHRVSKTISNKKAEKSQIW